MDVQDFLVCPLSKQPLARQGNDYLAPSGLAYPNGDFRIDLDFSRSWAASQDEYEKWIQEWRSENDAVPSWMDAFDSTFDDVYGEISLDGLVLDVAGDIGTVVTQAGIDPEQYVSIDAMRIDFAAVERDHPNYARHYGASRNSCFIQGSAELLPIRDMFFDTVHVRGCLDHFTAPHVALLEAYRVLKFGGKLVVGLTLEGAFQKDDLNWQQSVRHPMATGIYKAGVTALKNYPKVFSALSRTKARIAGHHDHHIFHPTYESLTNLVTTAGFRIEQEVWQKAYHNVLYLAASKRRPQQS